MSDHIPAAKLPPKGTKVEDLVCIKCRKTLGECPPGECTDPTCPQKPR